MVADDEETVRDVLQVLLDSEPEMDLVAVASDTESAIEMAARKRPDVALVDVQMPGGGGPRAAREIVRRSPPTKVIALSAHEDVDTVLTMLRAGALAYVVKSDSTDEILWTIHQTVEGRNSVSDRVALPVASAIAEHIESRRPASRRRQLQRERIRHVMHDRDFAVVYQPIHDVEIGRPAGFEALARFTAPPRRAPDAWLAEADAVGLLVDLELILARSALDGLGRLPEDAYLAVNLSPETAVSERLLDLLDVPDAGRIVLEMTEHSPIDDYDGLREALREPREKGVRLAVDDAGAGFSSLRHIVRLEPDFIKLDVTLTRDIEGDPVRQALAVALVSFSAQIGATVVAEGVETAQQLDALRSVGIRYAQGFYLGKPGPAPPDGDGSRFQTVLPMLNE
jgi:EAL domain-containing protein (putative c-di-GMP-specific phosphodiesterase class I)/DNA-binding NarL/FixJ family response regulator